MEILTLRSPKSEVPIGPLYQYRLYSMTYVRPGAPYAVVETQWDWPTIFYPPSDLHTASDTGDWYRGLRQFIVPIVTRSMDLLFHNRRLVTNIVDQIIERNRDWIAVPECCTSEALRFFLQLHGVARETQTTSWVDKFAEIPERDWASIAMGNFSQAARNVLPSMNELKVSIEGIKGAVTLKHALSVIREKDDQLQAERDAEEAKQQAIRDAEARRPPTRSGSIEQ